jgi:hypothetical protein
MVRLDADAVVIADVFSKKTRTTPRNLIETCRERLRRYDQTVPHALAPSRLTWLWLRLEPRCEDGRLRHQCHAHSNSPCSATQ